MFSSDEAERTATSRFASAHRARSLLAASLLGARLAVASAASVPLLAWASAAAAEPQANRAIAIHVEGQGAEALREDVIAAVPDGVRVIAAPDFSRALRKAGQGRPFGNAVTVKKQRGKLLERARKAAAEVGAGAALLGLVQRYGGKRRVWLVWVDPAQDELPVDEAVGIEGSAEERRQAIAKALDPAMRSLAPPPAEKAPEASVKAPDEAAQVETRPEIDEAPKAGRLRHEAASALLSVELGFELGGRRFQYSDGISPDTRRDYGVFGAPMVSIAAELYPAAGTGVAVLKDLGLTVGYARAFGLQSAIEGGTPVGTTYQRFSAGLRGRIPLGGPAGPMIGISGGFRLLTFDIEESPVLAGQVPDVNYLLLRGGVDGRIPIGPLGILAAFDWLEPFQSGEVYDRFRDASVHGIGATAGFALRVGGGFEVRLVAEYARFFSDFDPVLGDTHVAGGAVDEMLGLRIAGAYVE